MPETMMMVMIESKQKVVRGNTWVILLAENTGDNEVLTINELGPAWRLVQRNPEKWQGREGGGRRWHSPRICSTDWIMMMRVMIVRIMTHNSCWGKRKQYLLSAMTSSTAMSPPRPEWNLKVAIVGLSKRRLRWPCVGCRVLELRRGGSDCVRRWQATGGGACRRKWEICGWIYFPEFFLIQFSAYPKDFFFQPFYVNFLTVIMMSDVSGCSLRFKNEYSFQTSHISSKDMNRLT